MMPWIITNHNTDKIEVVEEFDEKCNVLRICVREKVKPTKKKKLNVDRGNI